jgi:hypothetical protein
MRVSVVAVPYWCVAGSGVVADAFNDHLNSSSRIGDEDQIKLIRVGIKESESAFANSVDAMSCYC